MLKFSVIIPAYNKSSTLGRAVASIQQQKSGLVSEIIIIDDGSFDETPLVLKQLSSLEPRLKVFRQDNSGVSVARNKGASLALNDYLLFLDADDEWAPGFVEEIERLVRTFPKCSVYGAAYSYVWPNGHITEPNFKYVPTNSRGGEIENYLKSIAYGPTPLWASAVCIERKTYLDIGGFPKGISHGEDLILWLRLYRTAGIAWSPKSLAIYYQETPGNSRSTWKLEHAIHFIDEISKMYKNDTANDTLLKLIEIRHWRLIINNLIATGNRLKATRIFFSKAHKFGIGYFKTQFLRLICPASIVNLAQTFIAKRHRNSN